MRQKRSFGEGFINQSHNCAHDRLYDECAGCEGYTTRKDIRKARAYARRQSAEANAEQLTGYNNKAVAEVKEAVGRGRRYLHNDRRNTYYRRKERRKHSFS